VTVIELCATRKSMAFLFFPIVLARLYPLFEHAVRILIILIAAYIVIKIVSRSIPSFRGRIVKRMTHARGSDLELEKRAHTLAGIAEKAFAAVVWLVAIIMALREIGFNIAPILEGAGVLGLAIGFGAQNLVRDLISGMFLLLENQIRVNDVAVLNGTGGLVEQINLRTTVLRGQDGTVHIFPNGAITTLSNMTHGYSYYLFDIGVAYKEDTDRVSTVLKEIADKMMLEEEYQPLMLEPLEIIGVDKFADSSVIIKARIKTPPIKQWTVGREMNRRIKKKFDELGIEMPFPHMSLYFGEASKPFKIETENARDDLKEVIREVLAERFGADTAVKEIRNSDH
jgi:moderate conductance mechanosensitive channel